MEEVSQDQNEQVDRIIWRNPHRISSYSF